MNWTGAAGMAEGSREVVGVLVNSLSLPNLLLTLEMAAAGNATAAPAADVGVWAEDLAVVVTWSILAVYGLISNLLIVVAIFRNQKLRRSTSYWLILSLSVCDISMLLICTLQLLPATALRHRYLALHSFTNAVGMFVYDSFWYAGVLHLLMMSLNRYISICHSKHYYTIFSQRKTIASIALTYFLGLVVAVPNLFPCCYLLWNYTIYAAAYDPPDTPYAWVDLSVNGISMTIMIFSYCSIVLRVRRSRLIMERYKRLCRETGVTQRRRKSHWKLARFTIERTELPVVSRREIRLFFQFATVSVVFLLSLATWQWLPRVAATKWVGFVVTSLFFINNATNPTVYLIFNSVLRKELREFFCPFRSSADAYHSWAELLQTGGAPFSVVANHQRRLTQQMESLKKPTVAVTDEDGPAPDICRNPTMHILLTSTLKPSLSPAVLIPPSDDEDDDDDDAPSSRNHGGALDRLHAQTHNPTRLTTIGEARETEPLVVQNNNSTPTLIHRPPAKSRAVSQYRKRRSWLVDPRAVRTARRSTNSQHCVRPNAACDSCTTTALRAQGYDIDTPSAHL